MRIHTYVVQHDKGFAPNPFWGICTLACCKPRIRKRIHKGDIIIGFGSASKEVGLEGRVIYWMRVDDIISFDDYWQDPQYTVKRPVSDSSLMAWYGDNIYHRDGDSGDWVQAYSFHSDGNGLGRGNLERDTGTTDRVLISHEYAYWGGSGPVFPKELSHLAPSYQAEPCRYSEGQVAQMLAWIQSLPERGLCGEPADWCRDHAAAPKRRAKVRNANISERIAC